MSWICYEVTWHSTDRKVGGVERVWVDEVHMHKAYEEAKNSFIYFDTYDQVIRYQMLAHLNLRIDYYTLIRENGGIDYDHVAINEIERQEGAP